MNTKQVAQLTGTSVRTLHHYDEIGLLCPARCAQNGYRDYSAADLDRLQQILFFRACGFALDEIGRLLDSPGFDRAKAYELQRKALLHERARLDTMLDTLDKSLRTLRGETSMSESEKFKGFDFTKNPYEAEARALWGEEAVESSNAYVRSLGKEGQEKLAQSFEAQFEKLEALVGENPEGEAAQAAMAGLFHYFNTSFGHTYTPEAFANLGQMYVDDVRFTKNIDKYAEGLAAFLARAMRAFADAHSAG